MRLLTWIVVVKVRVSVFPVYFIFAMDWLGGVVPKNVFGAIRRMDLSWCWCLGMGWDIRYDIISRVLCVAIWLLLL